MRVLLLSCNTGGGHNSAAAAIMEEFSKRSVKCDRADALAFISEVHSEIVSNGHSYIYRHLPQLFGVGYRFEEKHPPRFIYEQMALGAKKLAQHVIDGGYDAVVCTHIFAAMMMTEAHKKYGVVVPQYLVITDYCAYPGTEMVDVEHFFVPAEALRSVYTDLGVASQRVIASGIPIHPAFMEPADKRASRRKLHLPESGKVVLLFSGSIGCGRLHRIAPELERQLPENATLVIICGHNHRLHKQLKRVCTAKTVVVGFTNRIFDYMTAADLCISKPGGLSVTEMLVKQLPMVLMLSVPGCESHNQEFFAAHNAAIATDDWNDALFQTAHLIGDPQRMSAMRENLRTIGYPGGASVIADTVMSEFVEQHSV